MQLASSWGALVALGCLTATFAARLPGALTTAVLLAAVATAAQQHLRAASRAEEKASRAGRWKHRDDVGLNAKHSEAPSAARCQRPRLGTSPGSNTRFRHLAALQGSQVAGCSKHASEKCSLTAGITHFLIAANSECSCFTKWRLAGAKQTVLRGCRRCAAKAASQPVGIARC
jgi:hypothetical protein